MTVHGEMLYQYADGSYLPDSSQPMPKNASRYTPHRSTRYLFVDETVMGKALPELYASRAACCGCSACMASCPMSGAQRPAAARRTADDGTAYAIRCRNASKEALVCDIPHTGAITMLPDEEGFLYPVVDSALCIRCYQCLDACDFKDRQTKKGIKP